MLKTKTRTKQMNKMIKLSLVSTLLLSSVAMADAATSVISTSDVEGKYSSSSTAKDASEKLKQSINFGFANTTGNAETMNLNGKYIMSFTTVGIDDEALKIGFDASAFVTKNDGKKDNEEFTANLGLEQYITDGWLGYASVNWLRNQFTGFDNKIAIGAGAGKELFNDGKQSLKVKLGLAYNIQDFVGEEPKKKFTSLNQYIEYNNQLNKTSKLYVKFGALENVEDFSNDYELLTVAGLDFAVAESLSVTLEEEVRYDKLPPVGFDTTDTKTIVRVGYNF